MINVQIGGVPSDNEEQVTLVIEDVSSLGMRVPVILGMPTIHQLSPDEGVRDRLCPR